MSRQKTFLFSEKQILPLKSEKKKKKTLCSYSVHLYSNESLSSGVSCKTDNHPQRMELQMHPFEQNPKSFIKDSKGSRCFLCFVQCISHTGIWGKLTACMIIGNKRKGYSELSLEIWTFLQRGHRGPYLYMQTSLKCRSVSSVVI